MRILVKPPIVLPCKLDLAWLLKEETTLTLHVYVCGVGCLANTYPLNRWYIRWIVNNSYPLNSQALENKCRIYDCRLLISTPLAVESSTFEMSPAVSERTYSDPNLLKSTGVWRKKTTTTTTTIATKTQGRVLKRRGVSTNCIQSRVSVSEYMRSAVITRTVFGWRFIIYVTIDARIL